MELNHLPTELSSRLKKLSEALVTEPDLCRCLKDIGLPAYKDDTCKQPEMKDLLVRTEVTTPGSQDHILSYTLFYRGSAYL